MAFVDGKLGKMTIIFYPFSFAPGVGGIVFNPMYNPSTLGITHTVKHDHKPMPVLSDFKPKFIRTNPRKMDMELFFDGTGASMSSLTGKPAELLENAIGPKANDILPSANSLLNQAAGALNDATGIRISNIENSVDIQVQTFLKLGYQIAGAFHRPYYMMILWGTFVMTAVLDTAKVTYTMFSPDGRPLRAKVNVSVTECVDFTILKKLLKLKSADVSKSITVVAGDTLPLLCFKEYGDASLFTKIAEINDLKNYRKLTPGMQLLFPPLKPIES